MEAGAVFVKIKFNINNIKDKGHIKYIANRPGVEKQELDAGHIEYAANRPRSTGLFGPDPSKPPVTTQAIKDLEAKQSPLSWRLVFSLREEDARKLDLLERKAWEDLTRKNMEHFARAAGVKPEQINWVAAYHPEQGHPHVHVLAYPTDDSPNRRGQLSSMELRKFKRGISSEIVPELKTILNMEKTLARNTMLESAKTAIVDTKRIAQLESIIADPPDRLPPKFYKADIQELSDRINSLAAIMPGKGRAALAYMPDDVKQEARAIAEQILQKPQMTETLAKYEKATRDMTRIYTKSDERADEAWEKAYNDIRDRIANQLIREAAAQNKQHQQQGRLRKEAELVISKSAYRGIFRALDRECQRTEAQAELAKLQEEKKSKRKESIRKKLEMGMTEEEAYKQDELER